MTTAYLAGRYDRRLEFQLIVPLLEAVGMGVNATWLTGAHEGVTDPATLDRCAHEDLADIALADILVFFSEHPDVGFTSGGRHVELGYALGLGKRVVVIGPVENVFHHSIERHASLGAFLDAMIRETGEGAHDWTTRAFLAPSGAERSVAPYCYRCGASMADTGGPCPATCRECGHETRWHMDGACACEGDGVAGLCPCGGAWTPVHPGELGVRP